MIPVQVAAARRQPLTIKPGFVWRCSPPAVIVFVLVQPVLVSCDAVCVALCCAHCDVVGLGAFRLCTGQAEEGVF